MAAPLYTTASGQLFHAGRILVATVGLPARGKTHLSHALERYLLWLGVKAKVFSLGDYRRKRLGQPGELPPDYFAVGGGSPATEALRAQILDEFDATVRAYFESGGQVVIYDANNAQQKARSQLRDRFAPDHVSVMFLETVCDDPRIIERNVRAVKLTSPDYRGWPQDEAMADFYARIRSRQAEYETISNPSFPYVKIINVGERVVVNNIRGYLQSRICFFLMNVHNRDRTIYLARAGEARVEHLYKADADLSSLGWEYAQELTAFMDKLRSAQTPSPTDSPLFSPIGSSSQSTSQAGSPTEAKPPRPPSAHSSRSGGSGARRLEVWTSNRRRASHTCYYFVEQGHKVVEKSQLCELNPGQVDGLSEEEIKARFPEDYVRVQAEPYGGRYPRAESYHDLCVRIEPAILELERATKDTLIVAQASVLRVLLGYLQGKPPHEIPHLEIPEGEVIELRPQAYGMQTLTHKFWDPVEKRKVRDQLWARQRSARKFRSAHPSPKMKPESGLFTLAPATAHPSPGTRHTVLPSAVSIPPLRLPHTHVDKSGLSKA